MMGQQKHGNGSQLLMLSLEACPNILPLTMNLHQWFLHTSIHQPHAEFNKPQPII